MEDETRKRNLTRKFIVSIGLLFLFFIYTGFMIYLFVDVSFFQRPQAEQAVLVLMIAIEIVFVGIILSVYTMPIDSEYIFPTLRPSRNLSNLFSKPYHDYRHLFWKNKK